MEPEEQRHREDNGYPDIHGQYTVRKDLFDYVYVHDTECHRETDIVGLRWFAALSRRIIVGANRAFRSSTLEYDIWKPSLGTINNVLMWTGPWDCQRGGCPAEKVQSLMAMMMCHCELNLGWIRRRTGRVERIEFVFQVCSKRRRWYYAIRRDPGEDEFRREVGYFVYCTQRSNE